MKRIKTLGAVMVASCCLVGTSRATLVAAGLYDTGVDASGNSLAAAATDTHYTLNGGAAIVVSGAAFPIPPWLDYSAPNGNSRWISVDSAGGNGTLPVADQTYTTTFTSLAGATLSGKWSSDNASDVYLNGNLIGTLPFQDGNGYSFTHYDSFSTSSYLVNGLNTLTFVVHNGDITQANGDPGGWFGLRTQDLTVSAVPEPTTMIAGALLLLPFGASTLRILRKTRAA